MALTESQIQELYVAYFGRPADVEGKAYWSGSSTGITTVLGFAANMHSQSEFQDAYGSKKTATQVNQIYQNLFSRDADAAGLAYWTGQIADGSLKLAEIAVHLIWAAKNNTGGSADKTALENKVAAAKAFTTDVEADATAQLAYTADDADAFTTAKTFITGITTTAATAAEIDTQVSTIKTDYAANGGSTSTLTTGVDSIVGTAKNDTINAVVDGDTADRDTFTVLDSIDGKAGTDTLKVVFNNDGGAATTNTFPSATISNVEVFDIKNLDSTTGTALTIDFGTISGETTVSNNLSLDDVIFNNLGNDTTAQVIGNGGAANTAASTFDYADAETSATIEYKDGVDSGALSVTGGKLTSVTIKSSGAQNDIDALTLGGSVTSTTIDASSKFVTSGALDLGISTKLTVTGAGGVDLDAATLDTTIDVVDASAATGGVAVSTGAVAENTAATGATITDVVDMTVTTGSGADTVTVDTTAANEVSISTGAGNDTVRIDRAIVAATSTKVADVIDGGDGTDILSMTTGAINGHGIITTVTNFEELTINTAENANDVILSNIQASGFNTVNAAVGVTTSSDITFTTGSVGVLNLQDQTDGHHTVQMGGTGTSDSVKIVNEDAAADVFNGKNITATGIETLTIDTTGSGAATAQTAGTIGGASSGLAAGTTDMDVVFTGSNAITTGVITAEHIDASALTGAFSNDGNSFEATSTASSIKGGSGNDTIDGDDDEATIIYGNAGNDTIVGGSGNDTIYGGAGNDTIDGEAGADTIYGEAGNDAITMGATTDTIDGGAGNDTISAGANLLEGASVKGGAGTDELEITTLETAANAAVASEFETLDLNGDFTQDLDDFTNNTFTSVIIGGQTTTVESVRDEVIVVDAALGGDSTITMQSVTGSSTTVGLKLTGSTATDTTNEIVAAGVEIFNIEVDDTNTTQNTGIQHTLNLGATTAATLTITGDAGLSIVNEGNVDIDTITTVDASGMVLAKTTFTGLTFDSDNNAAGAAVTVTGSNGIDTLTGAVNATDTFSGGAGADVFNYDGGNDVYTGGAGNDTFNIGHDGTSDGTTTVCLTIADLTAGDTIDFTDVVVTGVLATDTDGLGSAISLASTSTLKNYIDQAAVAATGAAKGILKWFQYSGDTYMVIDNSNTTSFVSGTDTIIKATGLIDLSNSTVGAADDVLTIV